MVTVCWCAAGFISCNFLNPEKTLLKKKFCYGFVKMNENLLLFRQRPFNIWGPIILQNTARFTNDNPGIGGTWLRSSSPPSLFFRPCSYKLQLFQAPWLFSAIERIQTSTDAKNLFKEFISSRTRGLYVSGSNERATRWQSRDDWNFEMYSDKPHASVLLTLYSAQ